MCICVCLNLLRECYYQPQEETVIYNVSKLTLEYLQRSLFCGGSFGKYSFTFMLLVCTMGKEKWKVSRASVECGPDKKRVDKELY